MRRRVALDGEAGISLTVAICSLAMMITLSGVALTQAVSSLRQSSRQAHVKRALQAADAAVDAATYAVARLDILGTLNIDPLNPTTIATQNCVVTTAGVAGYDLSTLDPLTPTDPAGNKWCPEIPPETTVENATFTYRMSQLLRTGAGPCGTGGVLDLDRDVVGVGRSGGVTRRVKARLKAQIALLSGAAAQASSPDWPLTMAGTARVLGDVQTNNAITGSGLNVIAGKAITGRDSAGNPYTTSGVVPAGATGSACQDFTLPDVDQGTVRTVNNNTSRVDGCVTVSGLVSVACTLPIVGTTGGVQYDAAKRTLRVFGNGRAVLTGADYSFCSIRLENNGILEIQNATPTTRIFLDDPDNCRDPATSALIPNAGQITVDGQARIANCHPQTMPQSLQLYAVGNPSIATTQTLAAGALFTGALRTALCGINLPVAGEPMVIVAPHSTVELGGSSTLAGQVAAWRIHLWGSSAITPVNALANLNQLGGIPVLPLYKPSSYVECTGRTFGGLPTADPSQGC